MAFAGSDEKLWESGSFSDVEVRCGDRVWTLHKLILVSRCEWFEKALTGQFKEASSNVITIEEWEPDRIDSLLKYIYTGSILKDNEVPSLPELVELYEVGDYFLLPQLREDSLVQFRQRLDRAVSILQRQKRGTGTMSIPHKYRRSMAQLTPGSEDGSGSPGLAAAAMAEQLCAEFYRAVRLVYANDALLAAEPLRDNLVAFFQKTGLYHMSSEARGLVLLTEVPHFLVEVMVKGRGIGVDLSGTSYPESCCRCGSHVFASAGGYLEKVSIQADSRIGRESLTISGYCPDCASVDPPLPSRRLPGPGWEDEYT